MLSAQGTRINEIASIYHVDRDTVSAWLTAWEHRGLEGLYDQPRRGRPTKLTPEEQELALDYLKDDPRGFKRVAARLMTKTDKRISLSVLKRLAKKARLRWKRVRKSLQDKRDPAAFARCHRELWALQEQHKRGEMGLYYFDEAGFSLDPCIPYAWQQEGEVIEVPAWQRGHVNVLPELNLIEILWRKIKYEWLPFSAYHGLSAMIEALEDILRKFGAEYQITFA